MAKVNVLRQSASVDELAARVSLEFQLLTAKAELQAAKSRLGDSIWRTATSAEEGLPTDTAQSTPNASMPDESATAGNAAPGAPKSCSIPSGWITAPAQDSYATVTARPVGTTRETADFPTISSGIFLDHGKRCDMARYLRPEAIVSDQIG